MVLLVLPKRDCFGDLNVANMQKLRKRNMQKVHIKKPPRITSGRLLLFPDQADGPPERDMSGWNTEQIAAERRKRAEEVFANASREELVNRIVALETSLYKMTYSLSELDIDPSPRGSAWMASKLFPHRWLANGDAEFSVYDRDKKEFVAVDVKPETMHEIGYALDDSVEINDGTKLPDGFEILSVHQSVSCASIYGGAIFMGDVREAAKLLWGA